jgi:type I restriction-modification system DNA methylase subunit
LLPARIFRGTLEQARNVIIELKDKNWNFVQALFKAINDGKPEHDINKFNGGLFAPDDDLDSLKLTDAVFEELAKITDYDFDTDLNVNILGHIFEQSISDLEEIKAEINGERLDKKKGKRKKEGIYYTPEYITRYIVENAIGGWLEDRKKELGFYDLPELTGKDYESIKVKKTAYNDNIKRHLEFWEAYKSRLENIKVLDPACGSGAFLNQAFDYLFREGQRVNKEIAKLKRGTYSLVDLDKSILSNNLYGVDLNSESVEITKLSLWLKTASKHKELTALDENVKCGNSLIDDKSIDPKAFEWEKEFPFEFDVVIGNPPYGAELDEKEWLKQRYPNTSFGNIDSYKYFVNKSMELLKNNSRLGIIMPDSYLEKEYFRDLRLLIFNESAFIKNIKLGDNVFSEVNLPTAIVILLKKHFQFLDISNYTESIEKQEALLREENVVSTNPDVEKTFITRKSIIDRVGCVNLIDAFDQVMGVKVYHNVFISNKQENENYYPFISQGIGRYFYKPLTDEYIKYGHWLAEPRALNFFTNHKVIIREIVNPRIFATYIDYPAVVKNIAAVIVQKDQNYSLKYLLSLVNSKLITYYIITESQLHIISLRNPLKAKTNHIPVLLQK